LKAYLDIETSFEGKITVVGIFRESRGFLQLVGDEVEPSAILHFLDEAHTIVTYNGSRFDFPVLEDTLNLGLADKFFLYDLLYDCWNFHLYGGLKAVERALGIERQTKTVDGFDAMTLWHKYCSQGDEKALETLLEYNREDVMNLPLVEKKLLDLYEVSLLPFANEI
jgi:hypothetical protein